MKNIVITIPKKDIYFDVDAATHVFAKATESANQQRADAMESDTGDTFTQNIITRFADRRVAELRDRLSHFIGTTTRSSHTVVISTGANYEFTFNVEEGFQEELVTALADDMESYIANGVIADWFTSAGDAQGPVYAQMLPVDLSNVLTYFVKRKFPTRV